ncbi:hypothetical protein N7527_001402 [Penicillium freii]|uniref:ABC transporter domain-containing protein n=1 Tax=Penicillium freii TaxID=48697 RepID=A0A117NR99_PENFR|nr:hypothetical protein N7527_001402 [Penicillium freii]KUM65273.1 hypothetical protein ACN42_g1797 [Penicillium freii]
MEAETHASTDLDRNDGRFLMNQSVKDFSWSGLTVTVKYRENKQARDLICDISGNVKQGELVALMEPSGCGKTTLLNVLARRSPGATKVLIYTYVNGSKVDAASFRRMTSYVEQEDALIGSLSVWETVRFAADLSLPTSVSKRERMDRIRTLLEAFGIQKQPNTIVGTPIWKGISGGQKRRIIIIASIHQPSTNTFQLFDKLLLLSGRRTCYFGPVQDIESYFRKIDHSISGNTNPAEFLLDIVSSDFSSGKESSQERVKEIQNAWAASTEAKTITRQISERA